MIPQHQPTFAERIEEIEGNINTALDILEYYRTTGKDTQYIMQDIAEYRQELDDVKAEMAQYNAIVI